MKTPSLDHIEDTEVSEIFDSYPPIFRKKLLFLRNLILKIAKEDPRIGSIDETVRWGEPSYLTSETKSGSIIRIHWRASKPKEYAMYFHCGTTLISDFRKKYSKELCFGGNRSIIFQEVDKVPTKIISACIKMALTYNLNK
ncbi:MAG: hypothetical protein S4CHLAM6_10170 [Chlamydiae bacterium]|nr:hypothetical protein [Chlamydiota bacterium]